MISVTRQDKIHEGVGRVLRGICWALGVNRVLVKFQSFWKRILDYRRCRTSHDFWFFFRVLVRMCLLIPWFFMFQIYFAQCWKHFSRMFSRCWHFFQGFKMVCSWIIKSVEHALTFKALFPGCQHGVGERVRSGPMEMCHSWHCQDSAFSSVLSFLLSFFSVIHHPFFSPFLSAFFTFVQRVRCVARSDWSVGFVWVGRWYS